MQSGFLNINSYKIKISISSQDAEDILYPAAEKIGAV